MESSKIKNLIICILVVVNLFLAGLAATDGIQASRNRAAANEAVHTILENNGIMLTLRELPETDGLQSYAVSRDLEREKTMVSSVLGSVTVKDMGGNIMYYYGEKGQANFRGSGEFVLLFDSQPVPVEQDPLTTARSVMTVLYEDTPVINCQIRFTFSTNALLMVEGTRPLDIQREDPTVTVLDASTLMTRFVGIVNRSGYVCSEIRDIRPVLQYSDASGGKLLPVWEIETDARTYYLNVSTGEEQSGV